MSPQEIGRASDTRRDAHDLPDRNELWQGEMPRATTDRTDESKLTAQGQLTALVVVKRQSALELIDGFKRLRAAEQMGWTTLRAASMDVDEQGNGRRCWR